jgi:GntR family transcriptional regulator
MSNIDRGAETPIYQQIAATIRERIEAGDYKPGRALPSLSALCAEFSVAPLTMAKALRVLADEGLTRTVPRRGTFVVGEDEPEDEPAPARRRRPRGVVAPVVAFLIGAGLTMGAWYHWDASDVFIGGDPTPYSQAQLDSAQHRCPATTTTHHGHGHARVTLADARAPHA